MIPEYLINKTNIGTYTAAQHTHLLIEKGDVVKDS